MEALDPPRRGALLVVGVTALAILASWVQQGSGPAPGAAAAPSPAAATAAAPATREGLTGPIVPLSSRR